MADAGCLVRVLAALGAALAAEAVLLAVVVVTSQPCDSALAEKPEQAYAMAADDRQDDGDGRQLVNGVR